MNAGRVVLKRILALEYVEYNPTGNPTDNPTDLALIGHNIQLIHFLQKTVNHLVANAEVSVIQTLPHFLHGENHRVIVWMVGE